MRSGGRAVRRTGRPRGLVSAGVLVAAVAFLGAAGCGGDDGSGGAGPTPTTTAVAASLTTHTICADWLAAADDAKVAALASTAAYDEGGVNAWIVETRRTLATSTDAAAAVPDTVPVEEGVALVDESCAAVAPDDTVAEAIPAYAYANGQETTTAP